MKVMPQSPTSLQKFATCPKQYEATYITKELVFTPNKYSEFGTLVHKALENYLTGEEPTLPTRLQGLKPILDNMKLNLIGAETSLAVDKEGKTISYRSKQAYQRCVIDALIADSVTRPMKLIAIDWKTGKKKDAQIQHDVIKKCVQAKYRSAKVYTLFIYMFNGQIDLQMYDRELLNLNRLQQAVTEAYSLGEFPPKPNGLCKAWCDVLSCKYNGRRSS